MRELYLFSISGEFVWLLRECDWYMPIAALLLVRFLCARFLCARLLCARFLCARLLCARLLVGEFFCSDGSCGRDYVVRCYSCSVPSCGVGEGSPGGRYSATFGKEAAEGSDAGEREEGGEQGDIGCCCGGQRERAHVQGRGGGHRRGRGAGAANCEDDARNWRLRGAVPVRGLVFGSGDGWGGNQAQARLRHGQARHNRDRLGGDERERHYHQRRQAHVLPRLLCDQPLGRPPGGAGDQGHRPRLQAVQVRTLGRRDRGNARLLRARRIRLERVRRGERQERCPHRRQQNCRRRRAPRPSFERRALQRILPRSQGACQVRRFFAGPLAWRRRRLHWRGSSRAHDDLRQAGIGALGQV